MLVDLAGPSGYRQWLHITRVEHRPAGEEAGRLPGPDGSLPGNLPGVRAPQTGRSVSNGCKHAGADLIVRWLPHPPARPGRDSPPGPGRPGRRRPAGRRTPGRGRGRPGGGRPAGREGRCGMTTTPWKPMPTDHVMIVEKQAAGTVDIHRRQDQGRRSQAAGRPPGRTGHTWTSGPPSRPTWNTHPPRAGTRTARPGGSQRQPPPWSRTPAGSSTAGGTTGGGHDSRTPADPHPARPRRRRPHRRPDPDRIPASPPPPKGPVLKYQTQPRPDPATVDRLMDLWRASGWTV